MNDTCFEMLEVMNLPNVHLIKLEHLEDFDSELKRIKEQRTPVEYCFTCKPSLALYVLKQCESASQVIYMDADIYFFASPESLYDQMQEMSIAITPHRFGRAMVHLEKYGKYNAGWILFKKDDNGLACLNWWRDRCIEWCHDSCEPERFADQKYIDQFDTLFSGVWSIKSIGVNLAPWNIGGKIVHKKDGKLYVDGEEIIFFHFHNIKSISSRVFDLGYQPYISELNENVRKYIYKHYLAILLKRRIGSFFAEKPLKRRHEKNTNHNSLQRDQSFVLRCVQKIRFAIMVGKGLRKGIYMVGKKG
jgi:hypothetical protein